MLLELGSAIPKEAPLMAAGLDSLAATELSWKLGRKFNIELPSTLLFDHPTTHSVVRLVSATIQAIKI